MKRFITLKDMMTGYTFAWWDTVRDEFEKHSGIFAWDTWEEFKGDYKGDEIERYKVLYKKEKITLKPGHLMFVTTPVSIKHRINDLFKYLVKGAIIESKDQQP